MKYPGSKRRIQELAGITESVEDSVKQLKKAGFKRVSTKPGPKGEDQIEAAYGGANKWMVHMNVTGDKIKYLSVSPRRGRNLPASAPRFVEGKWIVTGDKWEEGTAEIVQQLEKIFSKLPNYSRYV